MRWQRQTCYKDKRRRPYKVIDSIFDQRIKEVHRYQLEGFDGIILVPKLISDFAQMEVIVQTNDARVEEYMQNQRNWKDLSIGSAREAFQRVEQCKDLVNRQNFQNDLSNNERTEDAKLCDYKLWDIIMDKKKKEFHKPEYS